VPHVRKFMGQRLRALREEAGLSQERLGHQAGLSGKFIGEVERGEKSISVDSLYHLASALQIPLRTLIDMPAERRVSGGDTEKIFALVAGHRRPADIKKAHEVLRAMFGRG
jgi:transcriptional regulator with XRE-family HTH domain